MGLWDRIYSKGEIHKTPSKEVINLVPILKERNVKNVLDVGCGTGRHTYYLTEQGFHTYGIDISPKAIELAKSNRGGKNINYNIGTFTNLPYEKNSMDFVLTNHALQYTTDENIKKIISEFNGVIKKNKPIFVRVISKQHPFYGASPSDIYGFSHVGFCIKNDLPVHFFDEKELRNLFKNYEIKRLEHVSHEVDLEKISVPLKEWVFFGYKK